MYIDSAQFIRTRQNTMASWCRPSGSWWQSLGEDWATIWDGGIRPCLVIRLDSWMD